MKQSLIDLPEYLYKFVTWDKEYHKDILKKRTIFFSSAEKFNDPFDSTVPLRYDYGTDDQIKMLYREHLHMNNPTFSYEYIEREAKNYFNNNNNNNIKNLQNIKDVIEFQRKRAKTKFGIFVLTTELQNILMWSHYSDSHRGTCIRFNAAKLRSFIENECVKKKMLITWEKVTYEKKYPLLNPFHLTKTDVVIKPLTIKSEDWQYENEYRFILFEMPNKLVQLPLGIIDQVYCGCKIDAKSLKEILKIAKSNSISVMQSKVRDNYFGLDFTQIQQ